MWKGILRKAESEFVFNGVACRYQQSYSNVSTILLSKMMSPHGSADDSNGETTEMLDINFHGIANLNKTEYVQKTANKYFLRLF